MQGHQDIGKSSVPCPFVQKRKVKSVIGSVFVGSHGKILILKKEQMKLINKQENKKHKTQTRKNTNTKTQKHKVTQIDFV